MTTTLDPSTRELGKPRPRKEDARLITGRSRYTDSITPPGTLYMHVVRSPLAHATITGIDTAGATAMRGVIGVYTAADLDAVNISLPFAWPVTPDQKAPQRPPLAVRTVHFAGEGVAVVVARSAAAARDAADLVEVDYDPLEPILDRRPPRPKAPRSCTRSWAPTSAPPGCSTPPRPAPATASRRPLRPPRQIPTRSWCGAGSSSSASSPRSWSPAPSSSTRPASRSPCGPRPRSRTSCAP